MPQDKVTVTQARSGVNQGHGHVLLRPDGAKARCGGPSLCKECASDLAVLQQVKAARPEPLTDEAYEEAVAEREAPCPRCLGRTFSNFDRPLPEGGFTRSLDKVLCVGCKDVVWADRIAIPRPAVEVSEEPTRDDIAQVLFEQRQPPYSWEDALVAEPESDAGSLLSICRDDADAVLARLAIPRPDPLPVGRMGVVERTEYRELLSYLAEANEHEAYHAIHALLARDTGWSMECEELREEVTRDQAVMDQMAEALEKARLELAALIPDPGNPRADDWPCANPADRECLQAAFAALTACTEIRSTMRGGHG